VPLIRKREKFRSLELFCISYGPQGIPTTLLFPSLLLLFLSERHSVSLGVGVLHDREENRENVRPVMGHDVTIFSCLFQEGREPEKVGCSTYVKSRRFFFYPNRNRIKQFSQSSKELSMQKGSSFCASRLLFSFSLRRT
jgi:hypothetical protein